MMSEYFYKSGFEKVQFLNQQAVILFALEFENELNNFLMAVFYLRVTSGREHCKVR